jgi:Zn-dependent M28 family amino/carboxypeptidase
MIFAEVAFRVKTKLSAGPDSMLETLAIKAYVNRSKEQRNKIETQTKKSHPALVVLAAAAAVTAACRR